MRDRYLRRRPRSSRLATILSSSVEGSPASSRSRSNIARSSGFSSSLIVGSLQQRPSSPPGVEQLALRRARLDPEQRPDLAVTESLQIVQQENLALPFGQLAQHLRQIATGSRGRGRPGLGGRDDTRLAGALATQLAAPVERDGAQPGGEARLPAEAGQPLAGADPGIVDHLFRVASLPESARTAKRIESRRMPAVEPPERSLVPPGQIRRHE